MEALLFCIQVKNVYDACLHRRLQDVSACTAARNASISSKVVAWPTLARTTPRRRVPSTAWAPGAVQSAPHGKAGPVQRVRRLRGGKVACVEADDACPAGLGGGGIHRDLRQGGKPLVQGRGQLTFVGENLRKPPGNVAHPGVEPGDTVVVQGAGFIAFRQLFRLHHAFRTGAGAPFPQGPQYHAAFQIKPAGALGPSSPLCPGKAYMWQPSFSTSTGRQPRAWAPSIR